MDEIVSDVSERSMALAVERNQLEFWKMLFASPLIESEATADWTSYATGVPFPVLNGIFDARLEATHVEAKIEEALRPFKERSLPMMWWTGPSTTPADLGDRLLRAGLLSEEPMPGMAVDLHALIEPPPPDGLRIVTAGDADADTYVRVLNAGFGMPEFVGKALMDIVGGLGLTIPQWRLYLGYLEGEAVATSMVVYAGGVAGIYNVATLPAARGRGIGAEITLAGLREAREAGYRIGVLQSSPMGYPVYERLGFRNYCPIGQYIWMPTHQA